MPNIALPQVSDVRQKSGWFQVDPSTGAAPYRAMQQIAGTLGQAASFMDMIAEKKQKVFNDGGEAELDHQLRLAEEDIDAHVAANQATPEKIAPFIDERYSQIWNKVDRTKVDEETFMKMDDTYRHSYEISKKKREGDVAVIEIGNANAAMFNNAAALRRANDPQGAFDQLKRMNIPESKLYDNMRTIFSEGVDAEVGQRISKAFQSGDVNQLKALQQELEAQEDGKYTAYEYTVQHNGKELAAGGLSSGAREQAIEEINSKISRLQVKSLREMRGSITTYYRDDIASFSPNAPIDVQDRIEGIRLSDIGKLGMSSGEYVDLQRRIVAEQSEYLEDENYVGMKDKDRNKIWDEIEAAGFSESAQMGLVRRMLAVEELRAGRDEVRGSGFTGFFVDPDVPEYKQRAQQALVSRYVREADLIVEGLGGDRKSDVFLNFVEVMDELETKLETLEEKDAEAFIKNELPALWNEHMSKVTQEALDALYQ